MRAGRLTARSMCAIIAHMQPEGVITVDESLTSGGAYWDLSKVFTQHVSLYFIMASRQEAALLRMQACLRKYIVQTRHYSA